LFAWIFFRADSITEAINIIVKVFTSSGFPFYETLSGLLFSVFGIMMLITVDLKREFFNDSFSILYNKYQFIRIAGIVIIVLTILLIGVFDGGQFIYFQF